MKSILTVGAVVGGVVAAKNGGNVWAGIGIGAAAGALIGTGAGMAAGAALAGSITATATQVALGATTLATTVVAGGIGAGVTYIANNIQRVVTGGGKVASSAVETGKNVYYQVTSSQAAKTIAETGKLIPSSVERSVCVLNFQPTLAQAQQIGANAYETVIRFTTNCSTFVPDTTVPYAGAFRNLIDGAINVINVFEVGFK